MNERMNEETKERMNATDSTASSFGLYTCLSPRFLGGNSKMYNFLVSCKPCLCAKVGHGLIKRVSLGPCVDILPFWLDKDRSRGAAPIHAGLAALMQPYTRINFELCATHHRLSIWTRAICPWHRTI